MQRTAQLATLDNMALISKVGLSLIDDYQDYQLATGVRVKYSILYHPFVCEFIKGLRRYGVPGVLNLAGQKLSLWSDFKSRYEPSPAAVQTPYPVESVDFGGTDDPAVYQTTAYSTYNWELFFHAPMLVATRLANNQRFDDAFRWLHYVFDPTVGGENYWQAVPLP